MAILTIYCCTFTGNSAAFEDAICTHESEPNLSRCYFGGNQALQDGGALYLDLGNGPRTIACAFEGNEAGCASGAVRVLASSPLFASSHSFRRFERLSWSSVVREKYHSGG